VVTNMNNESSKNQRISKPYQCSLCQVKRFKNIKGLYQHETHKHIDYKIPPSNIPSLPLNVIQEFRQDADATMAIILQDAEWSGRWYELDQKAYVILHDSSLSDFQKSPEMKIEWYIETITDARQYTVSTGFILVKFQVDAIKNA
ncbi:33734_t:CDS:2, partial [Gigaspora margarita]